ncbi:helix-turn-helix transcriptional regulator [Kitasatospora sp. NBC_01246]|uniref:helix-turn-helix domain-containing protein n=1 Tax=Kitasatospora sp. NBC_01246 TaxID=2903570 RepID=UPI002E2FA3AE|nr:helix-turn-helix transcriptional regulator [Kitasatospora sp. NBC_01246]
MSHRKGRSGPTASSAELFGEELRFAREAAGLTQEELGRLLHCDRTVVTKSEGGKRKFPVELLEEADRALWTGGLLARLYERVDWHAEVEHPDWFQRFVELEAAAVAERVFQYARINGLLQCEEYARALFSLGEARDNAELLAERVSARLSRQDRFLASDGPLLLVVLHESAIRNVTGGPGVMRAQMEHLLAMSDRPNVGIQVAPFQNAGVRLPSVSMFLLEMADGVEWLYSESLVRGHFSEEPAVVSEHRRDYDLVRGEVLSASDSRALIAEAMEEYRDDEVRVRRSRLAEEQLQRRSRRRVHRSSPRIPRPRAGA